MRGGARGAAGADGTLTVGINAQISPRWPGGSETMLLSLLRALAVHEGPERYVLFAVAKHAAELEPYHGRNAEVVKWPYPQVGFPYGMAAGGTWARLRERAGRHGRAVDAVYRAYRDLRPDLPRDPGRRQADSVFRAHRVDVVHFPYPLRFGTRRPFVYEPWDLQHRHHPEFFPDAAWRWRDRMYRDACREAALVVTATRWVKKDVVDHYGVPSGKVAVIPRASLLAREPLPEPERAAAWEAHRIPGGYAFYPAMTFPHKNHVRLLEALASLRDRRGIVIPLVCSGRFHEPHRPEVEAAVSRLRLEDQVRFLGIVPEGLLASLYREARLLVFPSLFEGLGAPLLEAMAHGVPVLAADNTSIPEVVGDAARLFDGTDVEAIADALAWADTHPEELRALGERGRRRVERYPWDRAAEAFVACYRRAAGRALEPGQAAVLREALDA